MKAWLVLLILALGAPAWAREGLVRTHEGKEFTGNVRIESNAVVVASSRDSSTIRLKSDEVGHLIFPTPKRPENDSEDSEASWRIQEIGSATPGGEVELFGGMWKITSFGTNLIGAGESFQYVFKSFGGELDLIARVLGFEPRKEGCRAALMLREEIAPFGARLAFGMESSNRGFLEWSSADGSATGYLVKPDIKAPGWIRIKRTGSNFVFYASPDGKNWRVSEQLILSMPQHFYGGVAVASADRDLKMVAMVDQVQEASSIRRQDWRQPRVELRSGSVLVGDILGMERDVLRFQHGENKPEVAAREISSIVFNFVPFTWRSRLNGSRQGALLRSGEFIEGEVRRISGRYLEISSVLLGLAQLDCQQDVLGVRFQPAPVTLSACRVRTVDRSEFKTQVVNFGRNELIFNDPSLGTCRVPIYLLDHVEIPPRPPVFSAFLH